MQGAGGVEETVGAYREAGYVITDEEVRILKERCERKMDVAGIENREEYMPLLFADMAREYIFAGVVNAISVLRMMEADNVCSM